MKTFLRTFLAFLIAPLIWGTVMTIINRRTQVNETLPITAHTLALGDSRIGCGVDPRVLKGSQNIALPAEPYLLSLYKLRHILKSHHLDTVIIGFAPHVLSDKDHRKFIDNGWATERLIKRMYPLVSVQEALKLPMHHKTYGRLLFMQYCTWPQKSHITYMGHFSGLKRSFKPDSAEAFKRHFAEEDSTVAPMTDYGLACLDSIVALAHREHIELYLVGVPVHASYRKMIPTDYQRRFEKESARYAAIPGVHVVDRIASYPGDSLFANCDHLNSRGARIFTRELRDIMRPPGDSAAVR